MQRQWSGPSFKSLYVKADSVVVHHPCLKIQFVFFFFCILLNKVLHGSRFQQGTLNSTLPGLIIYDIILCIIYILFIVCSFGLVHITYVIGSIVS